MVSGVVILSIPLWSAHNIGLFRDGQQTLPEQGISPLCKYFEPPSLVGEALLLWWYGYDPRHDSVSNRLQRPL